MHKQRLVIAIAAGSLLVLAGCGVSSPAKSTASCRQSMPISSKGLQNNWNIEFTPDLNFLEHYIGQQKMSEAVFTLYTKPAGGAKWHLTYTTGQGLVTGRSFGTDYTGHDHFVGLAKLSLTWVAASQAHAGYAIYRIKDCKN